MALRLKSGTRIPMLVSPETRLVLRIPLRSQEQSQWCWAACAQMVIRYHGTSKLRQCQLANGLFDLSGCCKMPGSARCNRPCSIQQVSQVYDQWGIQTIRRTSTVSFETIVSEIEASRPVQVGLRWNTEGGHVVLVRGWNGAKRLRVNDPADRGSRWVDYAYLKSAYGRGNWLWSWVGIRKPAGGTSNGSQ